MSTGLPSLYRRGIDIFGCKKPIPTRNSANNIPNSNLPPRLTINDLLLLGRDEIAQMKELKHSLRFVSTHKSRQQSVVNNISTPPSLHPRKPHPPTAPSYLDDFLYDSEDAEEDNEEENFETGNQNEISEDDDNIDILTDESLSSNGIPNNVETVDDATSSIGGSTITDRAVNNDTEIDPSNQTLNNEDEDDDDDDAIDLMFMANGNDEAEDDLSIGSEPPLDEFLSSLRMINLNIFNFHGNNHQNSESSSEVSTLLSSSEESNPNIFENALTEQESDIKIDDALSFVSAICRGAQPFSKSPGAPIQSSQSPLNSSSGSSTPRSTRLSSSPSRSSNISTQNSSRRDSTLQEEGSSHSRSRSRSNTNDQSNSNDNIQGLGQHDINRNRTGSSRLSPQISIPTQQEVVAAQIHSPTTASPGGRRRRQIEIAAPA